MSAQKRSIDDNEAGDARKRACMEDWLVQLDKQGYAVVPGVLDDAACDAALAGLSDFFAGLGCNMNERNALSNIHGIYQHYGIGHSRAIWDVRSAAAVAAPFERIYGTNDLLVSFDGFSLMLPQRRFAKNKWWFHMDQSARCAGRQCVQGYVNLTDSSTDNSGSLLVLPGSHRRFGEFFEHFPAMRDKAKGDWCKLENDEQRKFFGTEPTRVHGPRGSLVLWDSRTVHQNIGPACAPSDAQRRCVVYVCYQPRAWCSKADLKKKQKAFAEYRMTTHWPALKVRLFPEHPRTYGAPPTVPVPKHRDRVDTERMLELAGVTPMRSAPVVVRTPALAFNK